MGPGSPQQPSQLPRTKLLPSHIRRSPFVTENVFQRSRCFWVFGEAFSYSLHGAATSIVVALAKVWGTVD